VSTRTQRSWQPRTASGFGAPEIFSVARSLIRSPAMKKAESLQLVNCEKMYSPPA